MRIAMLALAAGGVRSQTMCDRPVDLVMILDESGSVNNYEWGQAKTFMQQIVSRYNVGQGSTETRVAIVPFSRAASTTLQFSSSSSTTATKSWIGSMSRTFVGGTCTGRSMQHTTDNVIPTTKPNGYRNGDGGSSTVVVFLTDGNPSSASYCSAGSSRTAWLNNLKARSDRVVPVGIGSGISTNYLSTLSKNMPAGTPYISASYNNLAAILDDLTQAACPTQFPTQYPTTFPTAAPTTAKPTLQPTTYPTSAPTKLPTVAPSAAPTFVGGCDPVDTDKCDMASGPPARPGFCYCSSSSCTTKVCGCKSGFVCDPTSTACAVCMAAPTRFPTNSPTAAPTKSPTFAPTAAPSQTPTQEPTHSPTHAPSDWEFFQEGAANADDGLAPEETAVVAAGIGIGAIIAIIAIVAAVVAIVVAILAATTGIFIVHKKMHTLDHHSFEGEMVVAQSVPMGMQITDPNLEVGEQAFANPMNGV